MRRRPLRPNRTDTPCPYTTLVRSQELRTDALPLATGLDREGGQDPHQLPGPRDRAPDQFAVLLGHPAAVGIGRDGVPGARDPVALPVRWTDLGLGPVAVPGDAVDLAVALCGERAPRHHVAVA